MTKLFDLHAYLEAEKAARPEQLNAVLESGEPIQSFRETGSGMVAFHHQYEGRISLDRANADLERLQALVFIWFEANAEQDDEFLGWSGSPVADREDDIDLRFRFSEEVHYVPAGAGYTGKDKITWQGVDYKPGAAAADRATVMDNVDGSTP